jgi:proteasome lid subunit RPN8/RPN11
MPPASVRIGRDVLAAIAAHARADAPRECCGLLLGPAAAPPPGSPPGSSDAIEVHRAIPTRNLAPSATRYDIDPADHFRILREARTTGLTVIGAYHSHPTSAPVPSPTDLAEGLPNFLYLITTLCPLERGTRAYYFEGILYREVPLTVIG